MSDPNIKQIRLVGGTETEATRKRGGGRKGTRKMEMPTNIIKEGGGSTSPGTITQLSASHVPGTVATNPVGVNSPLTVKGVAVGGAPTPVKVVLGELKKKSKVVLAAAKALAPLVHGKTRKVKTARKVRVSMVSLSRKIHKATTIRQKATKDTIADVKKELHKAGLVKAESKAPEAMLRQMYADFMMLKKRAL